MCQQCELDTYSAYGGRWQRTVRDHGRVGSVFAPAGAQLPYAAPAESEADDASPAEGEDRDRSRRPDAELPAVTPEDAGEVDEDERLREERARRLRELQLEDIRYRRPPQDDDE